MWRSSLRDVALQNTASTPVVDYKTRVPRDGTNASLPLHVPALNMLAYEARIWGTADLWGKVVTYK
jgi:hypothetical protein